MTVTIEQLEAWMQATEDEHLEFKEAKSNFHFETLVKYCVALANEGGGRLILGVTDRRPRRVVGSLAFENLERTKAGLIERLHMRVEADALAHPDGRVLVFDVPSHPLGMPIQYEGAYWMRAGEDLAPMTPDRLKRLFGEATTDFSAQLCPGATMADLDVTAMQTFQTMWEQRSGRARPQGSSAVELLEDAELATEAGITYAALILFGTTQALSKHLAQAEVVFEYRSSEASGPAQQREEYRRGFFSFQDELWQKIDLRNERQHFQQGFFMREVPTFNEVVIREALLNAISHRDYRLSGSVFVRQYGRRIEIVSPGGFPPGITPENILVRQVPRNRRIAEAFGKCGLVERSGQGMNRMFEECIKESKAIPDFSGSDDYQVSVTLHGEVQDPRFVQFMERIGQEQLAGFTTDDFLVIDLIHREEPIPERLKGRLPALVDRGVIEMIGRGRGSRCILSSRFYDFIGKKGVYTRQRGLDRETNKALLMTHIERHRGEGSPFSELRQVLPALSDVHIQGLVRELREAGLIRRKGQTRSARWFPAQD